MLYLAFNAFIQHSIDLFHFGRVFDRHLKLILLPTSALPRIDTAGNKGDGGQDCSTMVPEGVPDGWNSLFILVMCIPSSLLQ